MTATVALVAAVLFVLGALWRWSPAAPAKLSYGLLALGLAAGLLGIATWRAGGDSRWLVSGGLLVAAGVVAVLGRSRGITVAALVLALLGTALMGIATSKPKLPAPMQAGEGVA
jgi:hypothetical protein